MPKAKPGDRIAVVSPAFAAPSVGSEVHEQGIRRLAELTGLLPVEYPSTRVPSSARQRAADINEAFADPGIKAIISTVGGDDQITVIPHLDPGIIAANPKPFLGYSDNTNICNYLWGLGVRSYYGGAVQVHLGPGPGVDPIHARSLRAALRTGGWLTLDEPGTSEDFGVDWADPRALTEFGHREPTEPWRWAGPAATVTGPTWGGCLEVLDQIGVAGRLPAPAALAGAVLLLETSEEVPPPEFVTRVVRALGERGVLAQVAGVMLARPPASRSDAPPPTPAERADYRLAQWQAVIDQVRAYQPDAVVCGGVPFGHTRPQWIVPYGGRVTLDGAAQVVRADYS